MIQTVSLADIPAISQAISAKHSAHLATSKNSVDYLSLIIPDKVVVVTDKNGYKTYTLGLNLPATDKLQNLVVAETSTGIKYYLSSYTSSNLPQFLDEIDSKIKPSQIFDASYEALDIADAKLIIHCKFSCPSGQHTDPSDSDCDYDISLWDEQCAYGGDISFGGGISGGGGGVHTAGGGNTDVNTNSSNGSAGSSSNDGTNVPMTTVPVHGGGVLLKDPCILVKKLKLDNVFKSTMSNLKDAANNFSFERLYTMYNNNNPTAANNFNYNQFNGTIGNGIATWDGNTELQGIIHCHYAGLLSVFSAYDLQDLYNLMKNPLVSDDFLYGLVTKAGTKYVINMSNRAAFIAFGDKYLADDDKLQRLGTEYYQKQYHIYTGDNNGVANELAFTQMMKDLKMGINLLSANADFTNWQPITNVNNQIIPTNCN